MKNKLSRYTGEQFYEIRYYHLSPMRHRQSDVPVCLWQNAGTSGEKGTFRYVFLSYSLGGGYKEIFFAARISTYVMNPIMIRTTIISSAYKVWRVSNTKMVTTSLASRLSWWVLAEWTVFSRKWVHHQTRIHPQRSPRNTSTSMVWKDFSKPRCYLTPYPKRGLYLSSEDTRLYYSLQSGILSYSDSISPREDFFSCIFYFFRWYRVGTSTSPSRKCSLCLFSRFEGLWRDDPDEPVRPSYHR